MKNIRIKKKLILFSLSVIGIMLNSCDVQDIAKATYPDQKVYIPAAVNGMFYINNVPQRIDSIPTAGQTFNFTIDTINKKFIIPMGVYRSGVNNDGNVIVNIDYHNDSVAKLIGNGTLVKTSMLPSDKLTAPSSVSISNGQDFTPFNLLIDLDYLTSFRDSTIATGFKISSTDRSVTNTLNAAIIVISTKIFTPTSVFTLTPDAANKRKLNFSNLSTYAVKYIWDFGDGIIDSISKSPSHIYADTLLSSTIKLTAIGVLGKRNKSITSKSFSITPTANFTYEVDATNLKQIKFTNTSKDAVSYNWTFGDGKSSTEVNPVHVYAIAGSKRIVLTAYGKNPADKNVKTMTIVVK